MFGVGSPLRAFRYTVNSSTLCVLFAPLKNNQLAVTDDVLPFTHPSYITVTASRLHRSWYSDLSQLNQVVSQVYFAIRSRSLPDEENWFKFIGFCRKQIFMKLFKTGNIDLVKCCQSYFCFDLPRVHHDTRARKFDIKYRNHSNVFCQRINHLWIFLYGTLVSQPSVIIDIHYGRCYIFVI